MDCLTIRDDLLDLLYDEASTEVRRRLDAHLRECAPCREELASLKRVRGRLATWKAPDLQLPAPTRRRPAPAPFWLAAAAGLLLGLGTAFVLGGGPRDTRDWGRRLAEQDARFQAQIQELRASMSAARPTSSDDAILTRVEQMIRESEARNAVLLSASLADLADRSDVQRRYDLARMSASLSYLDGKTGEQLARTSELMGYVLQATDRK